MAPNGSSTSADRCTCGRPIDEGHQYCPSCGNPTDSAGSAATLDPAGGSLLLSGRANDPSATQSTVRTGPGPVPRLVGIGLALVGIVLMWALFRQPNAEVAPEPAQEQAVADTEPDDELDESDDEADSDDEAEEEDDGPTTTAGGPTSSDPASSGSPAATDEPTAPFLGEETGLMLAVGRQGQSVLQILDFDSGESTELMARRGRPLGVIGRWLILSNDGTGSTLRLDLDDLEADPVRIGDASDYQEVVEVTDDRIWTLNEVDDQTVLQGLDIEGEVIEEVDFPIYSPFGYGPWSLVRPSELLYDPAGGLYRRSGGSYELVAEGQVLAAGERIAVIRQCDDGLECQLRWFDLRSSGVIGFPAPPPADGQGLYQLLGGDRWLAYIDWRSGQGQLIEVATAKVAREIDLQGAFGFGSASTPVTSDGRWLADVVDGMLVVVDLDSGAEWPTGIRGADVQALFIEPS